MLRDAVAIAAALREAGVDIAAGALAPEPRDGRIVVALPGERLAWFPTSDDGLAHLARPRSAALRQDARRGSPLGPRGARAGEVGQSTTQPPRRLLAGPAM